MIKSCLKDLACTKLIQSQCKNETGGKKICARQNTSTKCKFFHKLHVTLSSIFPFPPYCGTCTALPPNVGVEETKNPLGVFPSIFFSAALSPSVLLLALQLHRDLMQLKKPNCWSCTPYLSMAACRALELLIWATRTSAEIGLIILLLLGLVLNRLFQPARDSTIMGDWNTISLFSLKDVLQRL